LHSFILAVLGATMAAAAWARDIPADAKRAKLTHLRQSLVQLDDKEYRLAPGALIRDTKNIIVLPTMVPTKAEVKYQLDNMGMVRRVWILTPEELAKAKAAEPPPKPLPKPVEDKKDGEDTADPDDDDAN